jgi:hypothetical protein
MKYVHSIDIGWVLDDEKDFVSVTATATKADDTDRQVNAPIAIPRCAIRKMTYLTAEKST